MHAVVEFDRPDSSGMDVPRQDLKIKKERRRRLWMAVGVVSVLALVGFTLTLDPAAPSVDADTLWTGTVQRGEMLRQVRGPGTLVPKDVRFVAAESDGRVERVLVKPGAVVEQGGVIAELINPELVRQAEEAGWRLDEARADMAALRVRLESDRLSLQATVAEVRADAEGARLQAEAERQLAEDNIIPAINYRRSQLRSEQLSVRLDLEEQRLVNFEDSYRAQLEAQEARVSQARRSMERQRELVQGLSVEAPMSGVVQMVAVEEGEQIARGMNIARIAEPGQLIAELRVPETQANDIQLGQPAVVDTRNGKVPGHVVRIDPAVVSGTVQVDVDFDQVLPAGARPDLSVDGVIEIERLDDVLFMNRPAYGQPGGTASLFRVSADGTQAHRVSVELGRASVSVIEVRGGLSEGDEVILSDTSEWDRYDRLELD